MSTLIHNMHIGIGANAAGLNNGLKTAAARLRNFADTTEKTMTRVTTSIFFAREAFNTVRAVLSSLPLEAMDATGKFAQRVGMTTQSLTEMQHAAGLAGVSANNLQSSIERLTRGIGEANAGTGTALRGFESLRIPLDQITAATPDERLRMIAEAMEGVESQTDRVRIATDLFGRSGAGMLVMLEGGSAALDAAAADANKLRIAFNDVDHRMIAMAVDAVGRLQKAFAGLIQRLTIQLAPVIAAVADMLTEMTLNATENLKSTTSAADGLVTVLGAIEDVVNSIKVAFNAVRLLFMQAIDGVLSLVEAVDKGYRAVMKLIGRPVETPSFVQQFASEWREELKKVEDSIKDTFDDIVDQPVASAVKDKLDDVKKAAEDSAAGIRKAGEDVGVNLMDGLEEGLGKQASEIENFVASLRDQIGSMTMGSERFRLQALIESGADSDLVAEAERLLLEIDTRKAEDELKKFSESVVESVRTPGEMLTEQLAKLEQAFESGFLSDQQYQRALDQARIKFAPKKEKEDPEPIEPKRGSLGELDLGTVLGLGFDEAQAALDAEVVHVKVETDKAMQEIDQFAANTSIALSVVTPDIDPPRVMMTVDVPDIDLPEISGHYDIYAIVEADLSKAKADLDKLTSPVSIDVSVPDFDIDHLRSDFAGSLDVQTDVVAMTDPIGLEAQIADIDEITKRQDEQTKVLQGVERNTKMNATARFA